MSAIKYRIGIDPGVTGAICVWNVETLEIELLEDMPVVANGKGNTSVKNVVEPVALYKMLAPYSIESVAHLERVASRPGNGLASVFSLGDSFGAIRSVLACLGIPTHFLNPASWKKAYKIPAGSDKEVSRALALQLHPTAAITRKKDHNRAEAILLSRLDVDGL